MIRALIIWVGSIVIGWIIALFGAVIFATIKTFFKLVWCGLAAILRRKPKQVQEDVTIPNA